MYTSVESNNQLVIFEGPQGSGKTSSAKFLEGHGFLFVRGIPKGQELIANREATNWLEAGQILRHSVSLRQPVVLDRSIWSLVAYNMNRKSRFSDLLKNLGLEYFKRVMAGINFTLVLLEANPEVCCQRKAQEEDGIMLIDSTESQREQITYNSLYQQWRENGLKTCRIANLLTKEALFVTLSKRLEIGYIPSVTVPLLSPLTV